MVLQVPPKDLRGILSQPIDSLLSLIDDNIGAITEGNFDRLSAVIDQFQQDPSLIIFNKNGHNRLLFYVGCLTQDLELENSNSILLRAKTFYNLSKIVSWKRIVTYLPTDVYQLPKLLSFLPNDRDIRNNESWYVSYMMLSWIYMIVLSPFRLEKSCHEIYNLTTKYESLQSLKPIVSRIHAQLLIKNSALFERLKYQLDPLTLNCILKSELFNRSIDEDLLYRLTKGCLDDSDGEPIIKLKILPKLFKLNAQQKNWDLMEDIISWFLTNMNNAFTSFRFQLAHSFAKIVHVLMYDLADTETSKEIIQARVQGTVQILQPSSTWDLVDSDLLHTNLLIIAELSDLIVKNWPEICLLISREIIPAASKFQQLRITNIKGSQIKDASNFIGWSIARSTKNGQIIDKKVITNIFLNLLMCSTFDRDLLVRRSANGAMQEILGRCISPQKILDNVTIIKIIELPIINLLESYSDNVLRIYELLSAKKDYEIFLHYFIDWLIDYNLLTNHDYQVVKLTVEGLYRLFSQHSKSMDVSIAAKLQTTMDILLNSSQIAKRIRLLALLIELSKEDIFISFVTHSNMKLLYEKYVSCLKFSHSPTNSELYGYTIIFKYWQLSIEKFDNLTITDDLVRMFFHIIRVVPEREQLLHDFIPLVRRFILGLSTRQLTWEISGSTSDTFWSPFEKFVRFNNTLACSALPDLKPDDFLSFFYKVLPSLDCTRKSQLIASLHDQLHAIIKRDGDRILYTAACLLDDYTITQQGDVGRHVRISSAKLIAQNTKLFFCEQRQELKDLVIHKLMRIAGEQVKDLKIICFGILSKIFNYDVIIDNRGINSQLLKFQHLKFNGNCSEFWTGYLISAGAIHFSDSEVTDAIDELLKYFNSTLVPEEQLQLCNRLVKIIPSAKEVTKSQQVGNRDEKTGLVRQDILKIAICHLNFWCRMMESGIGIDPRFNFEGLYAKLYNLHLLGNNLLKMTVIKLFPHLISARGYSLQIDNKKFTNMIIKRLLTLLQREISSGKEQSPDLQKTIFEALAQIYLNCNADHQLNIIKSASKRQEEIMKLAESEFVI